MNYNKEEVETHLDIITGYLNCFVSLYDKYIHEKPNIRNKLVLKDLIYYSEGLLERLTGAFDYILFNFKNTDNIFLLNYICLTLQKKVTLEKICRGSLKQIRDIIQMKAILVSVLKVVNNEATDGDEIYLDMNR